jgi:hypothetical protein
MGLPPFTTTIKEIDSLVRRWDWLNGLAAAIAVNLWVIPILFIVFWKERNDRPTFDASYPYPNIQ